MELGSPAVSGLTGICWYDGNYFDTGLFDCVVNKRQHLRQPAETCMSSFLCKMLWRSNKKMPESEFCVFCNILRWKLFTLYYTTLAHIRPLVIATS